MDSDTIWHHIDTERAWLADLLESLTPAQWAQPSLCPGWTVRDVGAHLTFAQSRLRDVLWPAVRHGFSYNAIIKHTALDSPLSHEEIVATIRGFLGSRRRAPFISELEPLTDVVLHTQDICLPLGIDHRIPLDAAVAVADRVPVFRGPARLWRPPRGVRLVATDADWSYGEGEVLEAPIQTHLLAYTGRVLPADHPARAS